MKHKKGRSSSGLFYVKRTILKAPFCIALAQDRVRIRKVKLVLIGILFSIAQVNGKEPTFHPIFNGKNLEGWEGVGGSTENWKVRNGILSCTGEPGSSWLATKEKYADFELRLEFNIPKDGNSGIFIRAPKEGAPWVSGLEIQVLDDYGDKWKNLKPAQFTGAIYAVQAPSVRATKKAGQWQTIRIRCLGGKCNAWVNGKHVVNSDLVDLAKKSPGVAGLKRRDGFIGLQNHSSPVHFRKIEIKRIGSQRQ